MQHDVTTKITDSERECLKTFRKDEDKYVKCMFNKYEKNSIAVKDLEFRLMFWRK